MLHHTRAFYRIYLQTAPSLKGDHKIFLDLRSITASSNYGTVQNKNGGFKKKPTEDSFNETIIYPDHEQYSSYVHSNSVYLMTTSREKIYLNELPKDLESAELFRHKSNDSGEQCLLVTFKSSQCADNFITSAKNNKYIACSWNDIAGLQQMNYNFKSTLPFKGAIGFMCHNQPDLVEKLKTLVESRGNIMCQKYTVYNKTWIGMFLFNDHKPVISELLKSSSLFDAFLGESNYYSWIYPSQIHIGNCIEVTTAEPMSVDEVAAELSIFGYLTKHYQWDKNSHNVEFKHTTSLQSLFMHHNVPFLGTVVTPTMRISLAPLTTQYLMSSLTCTFVTSQTIGDEFARKFITDFGYDFDKMVYVVRQSENRTGETTVLFTFNDVLFKSFLMHSYQNKLDSDPAFNKLYGEVELKQTIVYS